MKPYKKWYLKVSEFHEIYFECYWNKKAEPILYLHWWPGCWFDKKDKKKFDLEKDNVIFFDQRWSWKSKVIWGDILKENTTDFLCDDINKLLGHLDIKKVNLYWWSWWSTLALVYAIRNPKKVKSMIIRGIWLSWEKPEDEFLFWNWNEIFFPDFWEEFMSHFPDNIKNNKKEMTKFIFEEHKKWNNNPLLALNLFEWKIMRLKVKDDNRFKIKDYKQKNISQAIIEFHYMYNNCFIEEDYILKNTDKLDNINTIIVHGRYDSVCPASWAYLLHKGLKKSKLIFTIAWHSSSDKENKKALREALEIFRK